MPQNMPKLGIVLMVAVIAAWVGLLGTPAFAKPAPVEVTGQTMSSAFGDDGDIQAGVPFPTPRFTDKGNGTVKDNLTGLIWLKNANCFVPETWANALKAATLADDPASTTTDCGLSDGSVAGDWRLPNVKELQSLIDFGFSGPALSNAAGTANGPRGRVFGRAVGLLLVVYHARGQLGQRVVRRPARRQHLRERQGHHPSCVAGPGGQIDPLTLGGFGRFGGCRGDPPATPHFCCGLGHDPLPEAAHPLP